MHLNLPEGGGREREGQGPFRRCREPRGLEMDRARLDHWSHWDTRGQAGRQGVDRQEAEGQRRGSGGDRGGDKAEEVKAA